MSENAIDAQVGQELPAVEVRVTRSLVVRYAGASTDFNEIHFSDRHARAIGLPGVLAHGMWTMGVALRVVTDWPVTHPASAVTLSVSPVPWWCLTRMRESSCGSPEPSPPLPGG